MDTLRSHIFDEITKHERWIKRHGVCDVWLEHNYALTTLYEVLRRIGSCQDPRSITQTLLQYSSELSVLLQRVGENPPLCFEVAHEVITDLILRCYGDDRSYASLR